MAAAEIQMSEVRHATDIKDEVDNVKPQADSQVEEGRCKKMKTPRRVLHFSDGTLEEYSTDEEEEEKKKRQSDHSSLINPKSLRWGPWMYYWMLYSGNSALSACDYIGEGLANILGITSPKYQYEIEEYQRCEEEEKAEKEEEAAQMAGWTSTATASKDGIRHKIVDSSSLNQVAPEHIDAQVETAALTSVAAQVESSCEVKADFSTVAEDESSAGEDKSGPDVDPGTAQNSAKWDRF